MFLGIDVGTGGTRAVLVDREGRVVASAASEHAPIHSEQIGWAEQQPEDWWRAARAGHRRRHWLPPNWMALRFEAVGLTGQMHGCVMLDAAGKVLRPALIWCDQRTQPECDWLEAKIGRERLIELTCNPALPNFTLTKLLWVRTHQPEIFARIAHVLCPKDYVRYPADRRVRHRHAGGQRNATARRRAPPLVRRGRRGRRHSHELAAASL